MADDNVQALAMVLAGPNPVLSFEAIAADLKATWPDLPDVVPGSKESTSVQDGLETVSFEIGSTLVVLGVMPTPMPWSDLEGPCATSVLFPDAAEILQTHDRHVVVGLIFRDEFTPIERATRLTQVTASVVKTCAASLGVYWGNATMVIPPGLFRDMAVEALPDPPVLTWVDFRVGPNREGTTSGFTCGMEALGLMELETENANESSMELRNRFEGLANYLMEHGLVVRDGDTIGETMDQQFKVNYTPSSFGHDGKVMRLDYASIAAKPTAPKKKKGWFGRG